MRLAILLLVLAATTTPVVLAEEEPLPWVTVHFASRAGLSTPVVYTTDDFAACDVVVRKNSDGATVLNAALAAGCLESWTWCRDSGNGRFVTSLDGLYGDGRHDENGDPCPTVTSPGEGVGTGLSLVFWSISVNGVSAETGIDGYRARAGDAYLFEYTTWLGLLVPSLG